MSVESHSRQRVSKACDLCRRKKIKCDGNQPVCNNCESIQLECTFKDTTKKRGPPKGYIEAVENRLYKLENYLADLSKKDHSQSGDILKELNSPLKTPTGKQILERPIRRVSKPERDRVFYWQKKETADDGLGQLMMDENGQVRYLGKSSGYYLLQSSQTYQNGAFHLANYGKHRKRIALPGVDPLELPPNDLSEHLIVLYFEHFYPFLPLFFNRQLFSVEEGVTPLLLNSIYAVASRISLDVRVRSDPNMSDTAGDVFFDRAEKLLDDSYDTPSISTVQALLLLASHQHGAMKSAKAWLYSGLAFRMAQDLGLHRNCSNWNLLPEERERRKRVFWCCYIEDRLVSAMYGRATTFEERDCDVPFPTVDDSEPLSGNTRLLDNFINLIKICDILGHVIKNIYYVNSLQNTATRQVDSALNILNRRLNQWREQLPPDKPNHVAVYQLHLIYHTALILLNRPFIQGTDQISLCGPICTSAADAILSIVNEMLQHNILHFVFNHAVYYIFTAGIIFIRDPTRDLKINQCMHALSTIENTWITASKTCQILAEISGQNSWDVWPYLDWNTNQDSGLL